VKKVDNEKIKKLRSPKVIAVIPSIIAPKEEVKKYD